MHGITKVFVSGFGGAFLAQWAGPKITGALPESLKTPTMAKVVNASIAGGSAAAVYYALGAATK
jgi:hypothetical protein